MSVHLSQNSSKHEKQIESISNQYKYAEISMYSKTFDGHKWKELAWFEGELTPKALCVLKIKTYSILIFSFGIALLFQSIQNNLKTIKTKKFEIKLYAYSDTNEKTIFSIYKIIASQFNNKDGNSKIQEYRKSIQGDKNDPVPLNHLAEAYHHGSDGVIQNMEIALKYYLEAQALGSMDAEFNLGCYFHEQKNYDEAVKHFSSAADKGHLGAKSNLGICYMNGEGVKEDKNLAFKLFNECAEKGHAGAHRQVGQCHANGWGTHVDKEAAREWYNKAIMVYDDTMSKYLLRSLDN